eukprot:27999_1
MTTYHQRPLCPKLCCNGGLNLWKVWSKGFMKKGDRQSVVYTNWQQYYSHEMVNHAVNHEYIIKLSDLEQNANNFVYHFLYGLQLYQKDATQYKQTIVHLSKAYSQWKHPLILCGLAEILSHTESRNDPNQIKKALKIWEMMQRKRRWIQEIIDYLPLDDQYKSLTIYRKEYNHDIMQKVAKCYFNLLMHQKKMRYIRGSIQCYDFLFDNNNRRFIPTAHGGLVDEMVFKIRFYYWANQYDLAFRLVLKVFDITNRFNIQLSIHDARICYFLLANMGKYEIWNNALQQQSKPKMRMLTGPTSLSISGGFMQRNTPVIKQMEQWSSVVNNAYRLYLAMHNLEQHQPVHVLAQTLYEGLYSYHVQCRNKYDVEPFLGLYAAVAGDWANVNHMFIGGTLLMVHQLIDTGYVNTNCNPLCIGSWLHVFLYAKCVHYYVKDLRIANYLYQIVHKLNPFDALSYFDHSVLMYQVGKYEKYDKYRLKSKRLNDKIVRAIPKVLTGVYEFECNYCFVRGNGFKKCSSCKVTFYCSRKCQKMDWIKYHKQICKKWNKEEIKAHHKIFPYLASKCRDQRCECCQ